MLARADHVERVLAVVIVAADADDLQLFEHPVRRRHDESFEHVELEQHAARLRRAQHDRRIGTAGPMHVE